MLTCAVGETGKVDRRLLLTDPAPTPPKRDPPPPAPRRPHSPSPSQLPYMRMAEVGDTSAHASSSLTSTSAYVNIRQHTSAYASIRQGGGTSPACSSLTSQGLQVQPLKEANRPVTVGKGAGVASERGGREEEDERGGSDREQRDAPTHHRQRDMEAQVCVCVCVCV
jgi:hypothetical protein